MKIAITGANGHVGACLTRLLLKGNHEVLVLVHTGSHQNRLLHPVERCFSKGGFSGL